MRMWLTLVAPQSLEGIRAAVRVCARCDLVDLHGASGRDNLTGVDEVLPWITRDRYQARDWMATVGDFDRLPRSHLFQISARVLTQLAHPDRPHVLHGSTCSPSGRRLM